MIKSDGKLLVTLFLVTLYFAKMFEQLIDVTSVTRFLLKSLLFLVWVLGTPNFDLENFFILQIEAPKDLES